MTVRLSTTRPSSGAASRASRARFDLLFAAADGLPNRLSYLADAAAAHALVLRELAEADLTLTPAQLESDWKPPWDLRRR